MRQGNTNGDIGTEQKRVRMHHSNLGKITYLRGRVVHSFAEVRCGTWLVRGRYVEQGAATTTREGKGRRNRGAALRRSSVHLIREQRERVRGRSRQGESSASRALAREGSAPVSRKRGPSLSRHRGAASSSLSGDANSAEIVGGVTGRRRRGGAAHAVIRGRGMRRERIRRCTSGCRGRDRDRGRSRSGVSCCRLLAINTITDWRRRRRQGRR